MKKIILISAAIVLSVVLGIVIGPWLRPTADAPATANESDILYWKAPMDPDYRRDGPGKSPMGMDLVPVYADDATGSDPGLVVIDPKVVSNLGVRTETALSGSLARRIDTVGYVGYDEDTVHHVHTRVEGWIENLAVKTVGDPVRKGQVLFELYSPTIVNAEQEYLAAMRGSSEALKLASRDRLIALGINKGEIERLDVEGVVKQRLRIYSQTQGIVAELGVRHGMHVTPSTQVMAIADLDRVWVLAEVFERQAGWLEAGQQAEVELDYLPGQQLRGTVDYVYPELDPETRTLKVRLRFDNESGILRPNMFARVTIFGAETENVVHIPREALIRSGTLDRVVLSLGGGRFRAQPVQAGIEIGTRVEIRSGVSAGDRVVTSGQFLIDSESNIESALGRMDDDTHSETGE